MRTFSFLAPWSIPAVLAVPLEKKAEYAVHSEHFVPTGWRQLDTARPVSETKNDRIVHFLD